MHCLAYSFIRVFLSLLVIPKKERRKRKCFCKKVTRFPSLHHGAHEHCWLASGEDNETKFHSWRQKIELVLDHREVDDMIDAQLYPKKPDDRSDELSKWLRKDKTARMIIALTLSDEMLKNVSQTSSALEMWNENSNVHQRHSLLNKFAGRRDF